MAGAGQLGKAEVLREMVTVDPGGSTPLRGLGFDHPSGPTSSTGSRMTRTGPFPTFGHLGFTGCSLWVDPQRRLSISLLSNSAFPYRRSLSAIKTLRPLFHDTLIEFLESKSGDLRIVYWACAFWPPALKCQNNRRPLRLRPPYRRQPSNSGPMQRSPLGPHSLRPGIC